MQIPYKIALRVISVLKYKDPITVNYVHALYKGRVTKPTIRRAFNFAVKVNFLTVQKNGMESFYSRGSLSIEQFEKLIPDEVLNAAGLKVRLLALEKKFEDFKTFTLTRFAQLDARNAK